MLTMTIRGRALVNLKADPQKSLLNREIYRSIEPGYHMNKTLDYRGSWRGYQRESAGRTYR